MILTVPQAARRIGRDPETVRRWIREGTLRSLQVGTRHLVDERDLANLIERGADSAPIPPEWQRTFWGDPMPDVLAAVRRSRSGH